MTSSRYPSELRILVISPSFAPRANPEAFCGAKLVLALQEAGVDVVVLPNPDDAGGGPLDPSPSWARLASCTWPVKTSQHRNLAESTSCVLRYQTWAWPRWISMAVDKAKQLHYEEPFDIVVARSLPWYACVAAHWTAKTLRRPWIACMGDPWQIWQFSPDGTRRPRGLYRLLMRYWLERCLGSAASVVYPCPRLAGYFARHGHVPPQAVVSHVGWKRRGRCSSGQFTLVHAGLLGTNEVTGRSSLTLLRALALFFDRTPDAKTNCRLLFVGPEDPTTTKASQEIHLTDNVKSVGRVAYEESLRYIGESSVCVLVEGQFREGIFLPSKLADYLVARKPVLALSPRVGTVADMPRNQGVFRADPNDVNAVARHLAFLYHRFRQGELPSCVPPDSLAQQFEPRMVARRFLDLVEEVIGRRASQEWFP